MKGGKMHNHDASIAATVIRKKGTYWDEVTLNSEACLQSQTLSSYILREKSQASIIPMDHRLNQKACPQPKYQLKTDKHTGAL